MKSVPWWGLVALGMLSAFIRGGSWWFSALAVLVLVLLVEWLVHQAHTAGMNERNYKIMYDEVDFRKYDV